MSESTNLREAAQAVLDTVGREPIMLRLPLNSREAVERLRQEMAASRRERAIQAAANVIEERCAERPTDQVAKPRALAEHVIDAYERARAHG